jgi:hypothetical protein
MNLEPLTLNLLCYNRRKIVDFLAELKYAFSGRA